MITMGTCYKSSISSNNNLLCSMECFLKLCKLPTIDDTLRHIGSVTVSFTIK